ncbi:MAG TPA: protein kinase [Vicinamibacterales bacterium]
MTLNPGTRLGPYEITALLGVGGMGEVYRATDTKLNRDVAIKILPPAFANDSDRLARFQREAQVLASLNHPNIAHIHGLEESGGLRALVMELVEGEELAQRLTRGAIPLDEALPIAKQIAEAFEAAHEQGIIHRDLKPANIKVRPDGTVKVLDFGLAKALEATSGVAASVSTAPTITTPAMTQAGMILGTAAYMAPEQARGKGVDKRADIWAFGCVLFEMLTGRRAFDAEDVSLTLAEIMKSEPDWRALPASVSPALRTFLRRCLVKDPRHRIRDVGDVRLALEGAFDDASEAAAASTVAARRAPWSRALPVVAVFVVGAMAAAAGWTLKPRAPLAVIRFTVTPGQDFTNTARQTVAFSPDGTQMVYTANRRLYLRSLSAPEARPIPGIEEDAVGGAANPVFSPDGHAIAFVSVTDRALKTISVSGGTPVTICPADLPFGMSWDADGILFALAGKGIMRVSANGGQPSVLVSLKDGELAYGPQILPGGEWVLFTLATAAVGDSWDRAQIVVQSLKSSERKTLITGGSDARYLETGHLVYAVRGVVFAVPFDLRRVVVTGGPVPVIEGVRRAVAGTTGVAQFSVSRTGSLMFVPGPVVTTTDILGIGLFDRQGGSKPLNIPPGPYDVPRMSPDGARIVFGSDDGKDASIWIYELSGTSSMRRLTFEGQGHNRFPVWSSDSQRVAFQSDREGDSGIFWQRADGMGTAERLTKADAGAAHIPESWAPDGENLLYNASKSGRTELRVLSLKDLKTARFDGVESPPTTLTGAVFSPDGRWVAYASRDGRNSSAVYVQSFPPTAAKYQISKNADDAHHPMWSPDGNELLFTPGPGSVLNAVRISTRPSFTFGEPMPVPRPFVARAPNLERPYDVSRDGQRFLGVIDVVQTQTGTPAGPQIQVVLNWFEELNAKVPTK